MGRWTGQGEQQPCEQNGRGLSSGEAQQLVAKHDLFASATAADPPSPPSKSARTFNKMVVDSRRAHSSRPLHSRLDAATLFTQFARKEGFRLDERIPYGKMAEFLRMTTDSSLSRKEVNKIKCAMRRAVKLLLSGRSSAPPRGCNGSVQWPAVSAVLQPQAAVGPPGSSPESPDAPYGIVGLVLQHQAVGVWPHIAEDGAHTGEAHVRELCIGLLATRRAIKSADH